MYVCMLIPSDSFDLSVWHEEGASTAPRLLSVASEMLICVCGAEVKLPVGVHISHSRAPGFRSQHLCFFLGFLLMQMESQWLMAWLLEFLPPVWEMQVEFLAPGCDLDPASAVAGI